MGTSGDAAEVDGTVEGRKEERGSNPSKKKREPMPSGPDIKIIAPSRTALYFYLFLSFSFSLVA